MTIRDFFVGRAIGFWVVLAIAAVVSIGWNAANLFSKNGVPNNDQVTDVPRDVAVQGEYVCLPHRDTSGPQTMECAFGIKTEQDVYYALDMGDLLYTDVFSKFATGTDIKVMGKLVDVDQLSSNQWQKYGIEGIIKVADIEQL